MKYEQLREDIKTNMKLHNNVSFLRYLDSKIQSKSLDTRQEITDGLVVDVLKSEHKKLLENISYVKD